MGWHVDEGWTKVPESFYQGDGEAWIYGVPSLDDPSRCSVAVYQSRGRVHFTAHWHDYVERLRIVYGSGVYKVNGFKHRFEQGDDYYFEAGAVHEFWSTGPVKAFLWFYADEDEIAETERARRSWRTVARWMLVFALGVVLGALL